MKRATLCAVGVLMGALVVASGTPAGAAGKNSDVTVKNKSKWDIHQFFLSPSGEDEWGPDQLGDEVIETGGSFLLHSIPCDEYDVKLVDEDEDECVVEAVDLCASSQVWTITNDDLLECEGYD